MQNDDLELPSLEYLTYGNTYAGSKAQFQYKLMPGKENMEVFIWHGICCSDKSELVEKSEFVLNEEGYQHMQVWLASQYEQFKLQSR